MIRTNYKIIPAIVMLSFSITLLKAQDIQNKDSIVPNKDTTLIAKDTVGAPLTVDTVLAKGNNRISFGYGFFPLDGDVIKWLYNTAGSTGTIFGPLYFKFDHVFDPNWSIGVNVAIGYYNITYPFDYNFYYLYNLKDSGYTENRKDVTFSILARLNYHFGIIGKFDPYFGFGLGYRSSSSSYSTTFSSAGFVPQSYDSNFPVGFETTVGTRYALKNNFSLYAELGLAKSLFQIGATYKLK